MMFTCIMYLHLIIYVALPVFQDSCTAAELAMSLCSQVY